MKACFIFINFFWRFAIFSDIKFVIESKGGFYWFADWEFRKRRWVTANFKVEFSSSRSCTTRCGYWLSSRPVSSPFGSSLFDGHTRVPWCVNLLWYCLAISFAPQRSLIYLVFPKASLYIVSTPLNSYNIGICVQVFEFSIRSYSLPGEM